MEGLHKFHLAKGTKNPQKGISWTQRKNLFTGKPKQNYGIRTGAINNITLVDLDTYKPAWQDRETHGFFDTFGDDFVERFDTWTQATPSGGVHLVFQYDEEVAQTHNAATEIDIRNDGGYMVGPYSKIFATGGIYKPIRDVPFKPFPPELKEWLRSKGFTIGNEKKAKAKASKDKASKKTEIVINDDEWSAEMTPEMWRTALYEVPMEKLANLSDWMVFTAACKTLRLKALWDEISKLAKGYDAERNDTFWRNSGTGTGFVVGTLNLIENKEQRNMFLAYSIFKNITPSTRKPDVVLEEGRKHLSKSLKPNESFFDECLGPDEDFADIVVKSDTGTGKTTAFKQFVANPVTTINGRTQNTHFISITSRISLANEQYRIFGEYGIRCTLYSNKDEDTKSGHNVVTTIDSLPNFIYFDWRDYVVYIDEYGSVVDYLLTCPNLKESRTRIFKLLNIILKEARWVVMTDADVKDYHLTLLQRPFKYFVNPYKHNGADGGVPATEVFSIEKVVEKIKTQDKFLICCDSRRNVDVLHAQIHTDENPVVKVTATDKMMEDFNLDDHDRIIYSPSITQGLDSSMNRPVFCIYKEHTIDPPAMIQQIARCRDIEHLYYVFLNKQIKSSRYEDIEDCRAVNEKLNLRAYEYYNFDFQSDELTKLYMDLLGVVNYNHDCYTTNKFGHFLSLLRTRGFKLTEDTRPTFGKAQMDLLGELLEEMTIENFNPEMPWVMEMNERVFHIKDPKDITEFAEVFVKADLRLKHFAICHFFFKEESYVAKRLKFRSDFNVNKMQSVEAKVLFLKAFKKDVQDEPTADNLTIDNVFTDEFFEDNMGKELGERWFKSFRETFDYRGKDVIKMDNEDGVYSILKKCYKMFGKELIPTKKSNSKYYITLDEEVLEWHRRLYNHRAKKRQEKDELEFLTDSESEEEELARLKPTDAEMELYRSLQEEEIPSGEESEIDGEFTVEELQRTEERQKLMKKVSKYNTLIESQQEASATGNITDRAKRDKKKKQEKAANHQAFLDAKEELESRNKTRDV